MNQRENITIIPKALPNSQRQRFQPLKLRIRSQVTYKLHAEEKSRIDLKLNIRKELNNVATYFRHFLPP